MFFRVSILGSKKIEFFLEGCMEVGYKKIEEYNQKYFLFLITLRSDRQILILKKIVYLWHLNQNT